MCACGDGASEDPMGEPCSQVGMNCLDLAGDGHFGFELGQERLPVKEPRPKLKFIMELSEQMGCSGWDQWFWPSRKKEADQLCC